MVVKLIGVLVVVLSIVFLLNPKALRQYFAICQKGKKLYVGAVIRVLVGLLLLLGASQCRLPGIIIAFGILAIVKAGLIFVLGLDKIKSMLKSWQEKPDLILRLMSFLTIFIGALILYSI